jgi:hypothetical protein
MVYPELGTEKELESQKKILTKISIEEYNEA